MARSQPKASYADYLAAAAASEGKLELAGGEILAMSGGSLVHARLIARVTTLLSNALAGGPCDVFSSDARVRRLAEDFAAYPDATVVCGGPETHPDDPDGLVNPTLVVEVPSPSTEAWDRGGKFAHYRRIETLREVVFVRQDARQVEVHRRNEAGRFELYEFRDDEVAELASIGASVPLAVLYDGVVPSEPAE